MGDWTFLITILLIFITTLISVVLKSRSKDRCLKDFEDFHVTIEEKDGDIAWGTLTVYPTGLEINYREPNYDSDGHIETSYIIYREQYPVIHALYRYHADLSDDNKRRRHHQIRRLVKQSGIRRLGRRIRNVIAMLKDAITQSLGVFLGQAKKAAPGSVVLRNSEKDLTNLSKEIVGHIGNTYDPILENYIGRRVVLEVTKDDVTKELAGVLKEYSAEFLEVLDIRMRTKVGVDVTSRRQASVLESVELRVEDKKISVCNTGKDTVYVKSIKGSTISRPLDVVVRPGLIADFGVEEDLPEDARLELELVREMDIVVPRRHALIRHSAEEKSDSWLDLILRKSGDDLREVESREKMKSKPAPAEVAPHQG